MSNQDSGSSEIMMPMATPDALQHIEITVLRQLGENVAAQTRHLESLTEKVNDVRERVIRMEAKKTDERIEIEARKTEGVIKELVKRISDLEAKDNKRSGVVAFGAWMASTAPWLAAAIAVMFALLGNKK